WQKTLSEFASLETILPRLDFQSALERLRKAASVILFQVENESAPIQIMGTLESSGLLFDHLWLVGLHDQAFPAPVRLNPFLPLWIQRERKLPRAAAAQELEYARALLGRLLTSAPDVVLSCPKQQGESLLQP